MNRIQQWSEDLSGKSKQKAIESLEEIKEASLLTSEKGITEWSPKDEFQDQLIVKIRELQIVDITHQISGVLWLKVNYPLLTSALKFLQNKPSLALTGETIFWPNEFEWNEKEKSLSLGGNDRISFNGDRLKIFRELAFNKGEWVKKDALSKIIEDGNIKKDIWSIIPQMNKRIKNQGYYHKIVIEHTTKDEITYFRLKTLLS